MVDDKELPFCAFSSPVDSIDPPTESNSPSSAMKGYQEFYERRLEGLERFRHRVFPGEQTQQFSYNQLRSNLIALMEDDVNLLRQLMSLGERIEELKTLSVFSASSSPSSSSFADGVSRSSSMISLDGVCCDEGGNDVQVKEPSAMNYSNFPEPEPVVTSVNVPGDHCDELEPNEDVYKMDFGRASTQASACTLGRVYFSRQNSILRIPIPPSRGFRSKTIADVQQYVGNGIIIKRGHSTACDGASSSDDTNSCSTSSTSGTTKRGAGWWYTRRKVSRDHSTKSGCKTGDDYASISSSSCHVSQGSCDSGVHHLNNSADFLDGEDLIYV